MAYGQVCLRRGEEQDVRAGSLWIYDNEIDWADDVCRDGDVVEVLDSRMKFLAWGFFNSKSKITVRILSREKDEVVDEAFFRRRLAAAWEYRRGLGFENACRVVFGDSDGLPGLTLDKFGDYLSFQTLSLGMDRQKETLIAAMAELFHPKGICERNDVPVREKEGLPQRSGCVYGTLPELVEIREHDARMLADLLHGQKTGHFLDQQENRGRIRQVARLVNCQYPCHRDRLRDEIPQACFVQLVGREGAEAPVYKQSQRKPTVQAMRDFVDLPVEG